jgi:hypothetical protein
MRVSKKGARKPAQVQLEQETEEQNEDEEQLN